MSVRNFRFLVLTLLLLGALGIVASDQYVWTGIVGLLTLVGFFLYPKAGTAITFVAILVAQTLQAASGITAVGYLDDVLVFVCLVAFTTRAASIRGRIRWLSALVLFAVYLGLGLASSLPHGVSLATSSLSGFLFVKGALLAFAVAQIDWIRQDLPKIAKFSGWLLAVVLVATLANAAAPGPWKTALGIIGGDERVGYTSLTSIFDHPVGLGTSMSLSFIAVFLFRKIVGRSAPSLLLLTGAALANIFSFRRKSIVSMIAGTIFGRLAIPGGRSFVMAVIAVAAPLVLILSWGPLVSVVSFTWNEYFTNPDGTARTMMTRDAALIAVSYFPLGAGLGRYGSYPARQDYSPEYSDRGYQFVYGMGPGEDGMFLTDTFWPAVLGESGFIGLTCYMAGMLLLARPAWQLMRRETEPYVRWIGAVGVAWLAALLIESWVAPVFSSPPMFGLFPVVAGICSALILSGHVAGRRPDEQVDRHVPASKSPHAVWGGWR
ncbi:hypothetical protein [Kocuria rosea]|uniref:hypothetical protein n=1 Tax=Kocuria rosea TaxID=1275 RepID=UPI001110B0BD|nr:hypothetical protein [Kocuria rosea]QCY33581.1 hypothetical protein EQG70_12505 [Kocuria rosea]TQN35836.1 hypothetical protein FHX38_1678 [Kocuria rosea]